MKARVATKRFNFPKSEAAKVPVDTLSFRFSSTGSEDMIVVVDEEDKTQFDGIAFSIVFSELPLCVVLSIITTHPLLMSKIQREYNSIYVLLYNLPIKIENGAVLTWYY